MAIINLKKIGQYFTSNNLWHKPFNDFSQEEIEGFCDIVLSESNMSGRIISQCHACGSISFWRVKDEKSKWICKECHPPATDAKKEFLHIEINDKDW